MSGETVKVSLEGSLRSIVAQIVLQKTADILTPKIVELCKVWLRRDGSQAPTPAQGDPPPEDATEYTIGVLPPPTMMNRVAQMTRDEIVEQMTMSDIENGHLEEIADFLTNGGDLSTTIAHRYVLYKVQ